MEVSLSQREKYFYNINDHSKGILRQLGEGLKTEIVSELNEEAMSASPISPGDYEIGRASCRERV